MLSIIPIVHLDYLLLLQHREMAEVFESPPISGTDIAGQGRFRADSINGVAFI